MIIRITRIIRKNSVIHVNHHAVVGDTVSVEHAWGIEIALSFVDDNAVVVEVVCDAAMRAFCPSVVADVKPVAGTVAVRASEIVAAVAVSV